MLSDAQGIPLAVVVSGANMNDSLALKPLRDPMRVPATAMKVVSTWPTPLVDHAASIINREHGGEISHGIRSCRRARTHDVSIRDVVSRERRSATYGRNGREAPPFAEG